MTESTTDFLIRKSKLDSCRFAHGPAVEEIGLTPGETLLEIDRFAFTANNITYAVFGDEMAYWNFFPAPEDEGRIPVWGFAEVVRSNTDAIRVGERVFGFLPVSTHLVVEPTHVTESGFVDGSEHRRALHAVYNQYSRTAGDPTYDPGTEAARMVYRPLFMTSFLIDDFLADNGFFGAGLVVISSASAKTAFGVAHQLRNNRRDGCETAGLTSARNVGFVESLGCYDRVCTYDQIESLPADKPAVFVDIAGNGQVRADVHRHFAENLKYSCAVGGSHWDKLTSTDELPGAAPTLFFAPAQLKKRETDWGPGGVFKRFAEAWVDFLTTTGGCVEFVEHAGESAIEGVYRDMLGGRSAANQAHILSFGRK